MAHWFGKALFGSAPTARIACSYAAGEFIFGSKPFQVVSNGIDVNRFAFNDRDRKVVRGELGLPDDATVIGSVGRMDESKNPLFLLDVFVEYRKEDKGAFCLFVGSGDLEDDVQKAAETQRVRDAVRLVSATSVPERYYSAMDILLVPSLTEGFGLVAVEGQCSGLPVLSSTALPEDACCSKWVRRIPLSWGKEKWAMEVGSMIRASRKDRFSAVGEIAGTLLDAKEMARQINCLYSMPDSNGRN